METALTTIWFAAALGGAIAGLASLVHRRHRHMLLLMSTASFAVAGILGILSIGIFFLVLAVITGVLAARAGEGFGSAVTSPRRLGDGSTK